MSKQQKHSAPVSAGLKIRTFDADGKRLRDYDLRVIERLLAEGKVLLVRNHRGRILRALFRPLSRPLLAAHRGQHYSYQAVLPSGHRVWQHCSSLLGGAKKRETAGETGSASHVICIDAGRGRTKAPAARPLEFDSELRAAA